MLETFCDMNLEMARTGNFSTQIGKEQLLRLVAHNNVILARASPFDFSPDTCSEQTLNWSTLGCLILLHEKASALCLATVCQAQCLCAQGRTSLCCRLSLSIRFHCADGHHHQAGAAGLS